MRRLWPPLLGHALAAAAAMAVLSLVLLTDPYLAEKGVQELLGLFGAMWLVVVVLSAPGWLLLRLLVIRPALVRGRTHREALTLFLLCGAANTLVALVVLLLLNGGTLVNVPGGQILKVAALLLVAGTAAGAAAWAGERMTDPHRPDAAT